MTPLLGRLAPAPLFLAALAAVRAPVRETRVGGALPQILPCLLFPVLVALLRDGLRRVLHYLAFFLLRLLVVRMPGVPPAEVVKRALLPR